MTLHDARDVGQSAVLDADVCIVGGGPAGISAALTLDGGRLSVILLESGGYEEDAETRDRNFGENIGLPYYDLAETRHRGLGGSSQRWAGWCRPMDPADFDDRPWLGATGWPVTFAEMLPFYQQAAELCELQESPFTERSEGLPAVYRSPFVGGDVQIATWKGSPPTKFGHRYRAALARSKNVSVFTHATATELILGGNGGTMDKVRVSGPGHKDFDVRAKTVVLCAGAIESARVLLASRNVHATGVGNGQDLVGRFFMEHPHGVTAYVIPLPPEVVGRQRIPGIDRAVLGTRDRLAIQRPSGLRKAAYVIDARTRTMSQMLNFSTHLRTMSAVDRESSVAYQSFKLIVNNLRSPRHLLSQIRSRSLPEGTVRQVENLITGFPEVAKVILDEALSRPASLALYTQSEQAPNRESRVILDARSHDSTGLPRIKLDWRLKRIDTESIQKAHRILGDHFARSGLGVVIPVPAFAEGGGDWRHGLSGGHHHMGTARMADSPRHGVVDRNGQVHGVHGLYIADSAVFPVSGYANPLLTIVAMACRVASRIQSVHR